MLECDNETNWGAIGKQKLFPFLFFSPGEGRERESTQQKKKGSKNS